MPDCRSPCALRALTAGSVQLAVGERLPHHRHDEAYAAIILDGHYSEAGDTGRHYVGPGDVLFHRSWESHVNLVGSRGARLLVLKVEGEWSCSPRGIARDPDQIARLAEHDVHAALEQLVLTFEEVKAEPSDWPDLLAADLRAAPNLKLADWAEAHGLHPGSLTRGFSQVFGITPARYRLIQHTHIALAALSHSRASMAEVAAACDFADQAHMARAVRNLTGMTPSQIRASAGRPPAA